MESPAWFQILGLSSIVGFVLSFFIKVRSTPSALVITVSVFFAFFGRDCRFVVSVLCW